MKGLVFPGDRQLAFLDVEDPVPGFGEVVLAIKASGMCGSDLHFFRAPHDPSIAPEDLVIRGHEPAGIVVAVGKGVPPHVAKQGDRVMVHHYHGCTACIHCRGGWPQLCRPAMRTVYAVNAHGAHAPYMKVPASTLLPLDEALSFEAGAAIACGTGTAWGAIERLQPTGTETIAIFGQGPVGVSATLLATARGARVIAVDLEAERLALAKAFGAAETINARYVDPVLALHELTAGHGVEMVVETSGSPKAASQGLAAAAVWGKICMVGLGSSLTLEMKALLDRQLTVMTSYTTSSMGQQRCADFIVQRGLAVDRIFTHRWRLDQAEDAYRVFDRQADGKAVFLF